VQSVRRGPSIGVVLPGYPDAADFLMQDFNELPADYPDPNAADSFMQDFFDNKPDNSDPADVDTSMLSAGQHGNTSSEAGDLSYDRNSKENNNGDPESSSEDS
jgi:hypothetical protein